MMDGFPGISDADMSKLLLDSMALDYNLGVAPGGVQPMPSLAAMNLQTVQNLQAIPALQTMPTSDGRMLEDLLGPGGEFPASPEAFVPNNFAQPGANVGQGLLPKLEGPDYPPMVPEIHAVTLHVNGYRHPVRATVSSDMPIAQLKAHLLEKQRQHPHPIAEELWSRAIFLRKQPTTMNTSCKFSEETVLLDSNANGPLRICDVAPFEDLYLYLLCPEPPLVTERRMHRRLAKRDAGVCEAHRGQSARASRKAVLKSKEAFAIPALRARITKNSGEHVDLNQLSKLQALWKEKLPQLMQGFLTEHGLKVQDVKWGSAKKGSVIMDFDIVLAKDDGSSVSEAQMQEYMLKFQEYLEELSPEEIANAMEPMEVSHFGFVDAFEEGGIIPDVQKDLPDNTFMFPINETGIDQFFTYMGYKKTFGCNFHNTMLSLKDAPKEMFVSPADLIVSIQPNQNHLDNFPMDDDCPIRNAPSLTVGYVFRAGENEAVISLIPRDVDADGRPFVVKPFPADEHSEPIDLDSPKYAVCADHIRQKMATFAKIQCDLIRFRSLDARYGIKPEEIQVFADYTAGSLQEMEHHTLECLIDRIETHLHEHPSAEHEQMLACMVENRESKRKGELLSQMEHEDCPSWRLSFVVSGDFIHRQLENTLGFA